MDLIDKILQELNCIGVSVIPKKAVYHRLMGDEDALKPYFGDPEPQATPLVK